MATCPHCLGPLTDRHRCVRKRQYQVMHLAAAAGVGAAGGFVLMALVDPSQRSTHLDLWVVIGTAGIGLLIYRAIAGRA